MVVQGTIGMYVVVGSQELFFFFLLLLKVIGASIDDEHLAVLVPSSQFGPSVLFINIEKKEKLISSVNICIV